MGGKKAFPLTVVLGDDVSDVGHQDDCAVHPNGQPRGGDAPRLAHVPLPVSSLVLYALQIAVGCGVEDGAALEHNLRQGVGACTCACAFVVGTPARGFAGGLESAE